MCNNATGICNISRCVVAQFRPSPEVKRRVSTRKNFCERLKHVRGRLETKRKYIDHFTFLTNYLTNNNVFY